MSEKPKNDWAGAFAKIGVTAITSGYAVSFFIFAGLVFISYRLDSKDLKEVLLAPFQSYFFGFSGWILFVGSLFMCKFLLNTQAKIHSKEMNRIAEVKNELMQPHFSTPLPSTKRDNLK